MKKQILILVAILLVFTTCRKKSNISITAWNYALGEPITNAEVIIIESQYKGGLFNAGTQCKEIAHATTDANGQCFFDNLKLKKNQNVQYAAKIKYSYDKSDNYHCNVTENSEIKLENSNNKVLNSSTYDCFFKVQFNNLLNPSQTNDSIAIGIISPKYEVPGQPYPFGGGVYSGWSYYGDNGFPYPSVVISNYSTKSNAGKHVLKIYKKKMGVVTQTIDTIKIYPYETKTIEINW